MTEQEEYRPHKHLKPETLSNDMIILELMRLAGTPAGNLFGTNESIYAAELTEEILNFRGTKGKQRYAENVHDMIELAEHADNAWFLLRVFQPDIHSAHALNSYQAYRRTIEAEHNAYDLENFIERIYPETECECPIPSKNLTSEARFTAMREELIQELPKTDDVSMGRISQLAYRYLRYGHLVHSPYEMKQDWEHLCEQTLQYDAPTALRVLTQCMAEPGHALEPRAIWEAMNRLMRDMDEEFLSNIDERLNEHQRKLAPLDSAKGSDYLASEHYFRELALRSLTNRKHRRPLLPLDHGADLSGENDPGWEEKARKTKKNMDDGMIRGRGRN